jgi:hypothetical protein
MKQNIADIEKKKEKFEEKPALLLHGERAKKERMKKRE